MSKKIKNTMATKATYKRLGDYIQLVDVRNRDLKYEKLMGINIDNFFMPSVANVIGTVSFNSGELKELLKQKEERKQDVLNLFQRVGIWN